MDAPRQLPQLLQAHRQLVQRGAQLQLRAVRVAAQLGERHPQRQRQRHEPLLRAVVQVPLQPPPGLVAGGDDALARRRQRRARVGVRDGRAGQRRERAQPPLGVRRQPVLAQPPGDQRAPDVARDDDRRGDGLLDRPADRPARPSARDGRWSARPPSPGPASIGTSAPCGRTSAASTSPQLATIIACSPGSNRSSVQPSAPTSRPASSATIRNTTSLSRPRATAVATRSSASCSATSSCASRSALSWSVTSRPIPTTPVSYALVVVQPDVRPLDLAPLAGAQDDHAAVVRRERPLPHQLHELVVAAAERLDVRPADQLVARPAAEPDQVLVDVGQAAVQIDLARDQVDRLQHVHHPPLGDLQRPLRRPARRSCPGRCRGCR